HPGGGELQSRDPATALRGRGPAGSRAEQVRGLRQRRAIPLRRPTGARGSDPDDRRAELGRRARAVTLLVERDVFDGAHISVVNHLVWEPVDVFVAVVVDIGVADIRGTQILDLRQHAGVGHQGDSVRLAPLRRHLFRGLVFLDRYVPLFAVLHVDARDLAVFDGDRSRVLAVLVNDVVTV